MKFDVLDNSDEGDAGIVLIKKQKDEVYECLRI